MPKFYFHVTDESGTVKADEKGTELADLVCARDWAMQAARELVEKEGSPAGIPLDELARLAIEVRDSSGETVCTVPLSEALPNSNPPLSPTATPPP